MESFTPPDCVCLKNPDGSLPVCDVSSTRTGTCCLDERGACCWAGDCIDLSNYQDGLAGSGDGQSLQYLCDTEYSRAPAGQPLYETHYLEGKLCHTNPCCIGLVSVTGPAVQGNQVVINDAFLTFMDALVACATAPGLDVKLIVQSTSRCGVPTNSGDPDITPALNSNHLIGMAIDTNLNLPSEGGCNRNCMAAGYCAYHAHLSACKHKFPTPPQKNAKNSRINRFFTCVRGEGVKVGADFHTPDWNHFDAGGVPASTTREAYQKILKQYCMNECPRVPKGNPGHAACNC